MIKSYPFDVHVNPERRTFRFINMDKKPCIINSKEALCLLSDFVKIIFDDLQCEGDQNHRFSLPKNEVIKIIQNKTKDIEREFGGLSYFSIENAHAVQQKILSAQIYTFATQSIGILTLGDCLLAISAKLDVRTGSRLMRTCKTIYAKNKDSFLHQFKAIKPVLIRKFHDRIARQAVSESAYRDKCRREAEQRRENRIACLR